MASPTLGVAGFPPSFFETKYRRDRLNGPEWLDEIGLDLLELQMTYGPRTKPETAEKYRERAERFGITLTVHGSYYTVFTSPKQDVIDRSLKRLETTCSLAAKAGASRVVLHPGSAFGDREGALARFIENIDRFIRSALPDGVDVYPETAGKLAQLGSLAEILAICREVERCRPCVDFGHLHARQLSELDTDNGWTFTTVEDYLGAFEWLERHVEPEDRPLVHFHVTPIQYGPKGEISHRRYGERISAEDADGDRFVEGEPWLPEATQLAEAVAKNGYPAWIVCEAGNTQDKGALAMKQAYLAASG